MKNPKGIPKNALIISHQFLFFFYIFLSILKIFKCVLTLYHTIPTYNDPKEEGFGKHCGKRRKCWQPAFSPFPTVFSSLSKREIIILAMFNLSSENAFNMITSKILFDKELMCFTVFIVHRRQ